MAPLSDAVAAANAELVRAELAAANARSQFFKQQVNQHELPQPPEWPQQPQQYSQQYPQRPQRPPCAKPPRPTRPSSARGPRRPPVAACSDGLGRPSTPKNGPQWSLGEKPEMIMGATVPSWGKSIPGPDYTYDTDVYKVRQPVHSIGAKLPSESDIMARRSPGIMYGGDHIDPVKPRPSQFSMGRKLPDESDLMSRRSPGPGAYGGSASSAKKQAMVDSTKRRSNRASSFGCSKRWSGTTHTLVQNGAYSRYS